MLTDYVQQYEIEGFDENYAEIAATMEGISAQKDDIVGAYNENKDSYTAEKIDELIGILSAQIESANTFVTNLQDTVAQVEESINATQG